MKTRSIILLVALIFVFALALTSCDAVSQLFPGQQHEHKWADATCTSPKTCTECDATEGEALGHTEQVIPGKEATCTEAGYTEGKLCTVCNEVTVAQTATVAKGHTATAAGCETASTCSVCHVVLSPALGHDEVDLAPKNPTCTEKGLEAGKGCSRCDKIFVAQKEIPALGHTDETLSRVEPDCVNTGLTEGKKCSVCGVITVAQEEIPALGRTEETLSRVEPDCVKTGLTEGKKCSVCGVITVAQETIPALGHTEQTLARVEPDCVKTGLTEGKKCSVCGEITVAQETIPALGHTEEVITGFAPTCTATGLTDGKKCTVCGVITQAQQDIPANNHKDDDGDFKCDVCSADLCTSHVASDPVQEEYNAATCTEAGSYVLVTYCANCHYIMNRETKVIDALGHTEEVLERVEPTCTQTGLTEGKKCSVCDVILEEQNKIDALPHTPGEWIVTTPATCETDGERLAQCTVCSAVAKQETINKLGHAYKTVYTWSEDGSTCTAAEICQNDNDHVRNTETATVSTVDLAVSKSGVKFTYNVVFANDSFEAQSVEKSGELALENKIATITAPEIAGRVASHDYVKFGFHDETATYEFTINYSEIDVWDGSVATEFAGGTGTADDPYIIKTGAQLAYLAKLAMDGTAAKDSVYGTGIYYKLAASLDLSGHQWTPIAMYDKGYSWTYFDGNFDGAGHKIIFKIETTSYGYGLFAGLGAKSVVKNLTLYGSVKTAHRAGALAYITQSGAYIENVTNYASVTCTATGGYVGGLVGSLSGADSVMNNCVNYGTVYSAGKQVGGITGTTPATVTNSVNFGDVTGTAGTAGGIIGTTTTANITGCANYGAIDGAGTTGGIVGNITTNTTVSLCVNYGTITASSWNVGGIGGYMGAGSSILGCVNRGSVILSDKSNVGGIIGNNLGAVGDYVAEDGTVYHTVNYGTVTGPKNVGGIAGYAYDSEKAVTGTMTNAVNYGTVKGTACNSTGIDQICLKGIKTGCVSEGTASVGDHKLTHTDAKDATCDVAGNVAYDYCSVCEKNYDSEGNVIADVTVPALGHAWGEGVEADGKITYTCGNCGATKEEQIVEDPFTVTVNHLYLNGSVAADAETIEVTEGDIYTVNAKTIEGYVPSHDYVKLHILEKTNVVTIYYSELDTWDGTTVSAGLSGEGTAESPYLIQSAADFAYLASQLNAAAVGQTENFKGQYFKMTKSIDLGGKLLIAGNHSGWNKYQGFGGTFDGNNCTIRGINVEPTTGTSSALFGCITSAGTLKNLIVYGNAKGASTVGGVVAYQLGAVDNVTSYVTVTATGGTVGGVVANQEGSAKALTNCVNYGSVTSSSYIVGGVTGSGGATITNCVNWGSVQGGSESIGGITGTTKNKGTISGCVNYGSVTMTATDKGMVGGIAGKLLKPIADCYNYGVITGANTMGGIAGSADSISTITNCYNYGTINATSWLIGGIAGSADADVTGCKNYGDINNTADCAGGIVGSSKAIVSGCENYGTVKGTGRCAGIAYYSSGTIENCVNNGAVIGGWDLGGILAWVGDGQSATITGCTNNANITGTWNNGGIFGLAHDNAGTVTITGCTNNGHILSTTGGQITIAVKAVITDCTENGSWKAAEETAE